MRQRQRQQPFFVKRVRLRKSIIKTNEILETISNYDLQSSQYSAFSCALRSQEGDFKERKSSLPLSRATIDQFHLYAASSSLNANTVNNIHKICSDQRKKAVVFEMGRAGLEARRIVAHPMQSRRLQCASDDRRQRKREQSCSRIVDLTISIDAFDSVLAPSCSSAKKGLSAEQAEKSLVKCSTAVNPNRRNRTYLYQKMAQMESATNNEENHVYEKRIKSYTEFLWKCMLGHNVYIDLDLKAASLTNRPFKPCKAYVGLGNNSNMVKSLLKRRFWWSLSEEMTDECALVWTQVKVNKIYQKQERAATNKLTYSPTVMPQNMEDFRFIQSSNLKKRSRENNLIFKRKENEEFNLAFAPHHKIWNQTDFAFLKALYKEKELRAGLQSKQGIKESYQLKTDTVRKKYKYIKKVEFPSNAEYESQQDYYRVRPLIHNHLQNNFYLGNKKALLYNLRQYYQKIGEDVFDYVPLTFHIKSGFSDPQYKKFSEYYQARARTIKKQLMNEKEKQKGRNIWIVKPGQNSNQGRGITVIDEQYELDRIIKQAMAKSKGSKAGENGFDSQTFIVQLYIDRPLLYNDRKFDIRHYMLVTNLYGATRAYWYEEGYIRTSAYQFNIHSFDPQIHLTNDAIQKHYSEYGRHEPANKISYSEFQNYLNSLGEKKCSFRQEIIPKMKQMGKDAARSVYTKMNPQDQMHNFEIFGLDFMIDRNLKPWLIEINTNPCLECVCPLLDRIIPYMVEQALKLSIDLVYPPPAHYPNTSKHCAPLINLSTFKYELIFDSLSEGEKIQKLLSKQSTHLVNEIGAIEEDEEFKDDGKEIRLEDFT